MKKLMMLVSLSLCSCSDYIIDPRVSKHPKELIRDKIECESLIKENVNSIVRLVDGDTLMRKCLSNRGHSILN